MRGRILGFDQHSGTGVLRAEDGRRYRFVLAQWREAGDPEKGDRVDFEPVSGQKAADIYLVSEAGLGARIRALPGMVRAIWHWFRRHPEAVLALLLMAATALPVYGFLGVQEPLLAAPRVIDRLELGLGRIRMLVADIPEAGTSAAAIRAILPVVYLLWAVPVLALILLYRSLSELPRRAFAMWSGAAAVLLPVLVPLAIAVPTTLMVLSRMPPNMRATVAGSIFDATSFGPFKDIAIGGMVIMLLGFGLVVWGMQPEPAPRRRRPVQAGPAAATAQATRARPLRQVPRPPAPPQSGRSVPPVPVDAEPPAIPPPPAMPRTAPPALPPQRKVPPVAGPAHPPVLPRPSAPPPPPPAPKPRAPARAAVQDFAPPVRKPVVPPKPAQAEEAEDPLPSVLTRGRLPAGAFEPPDEMDARAGGGISAEATARGWEVEATGRMVAKPPASLPPLRGSHADDDLPPRPNGALADIDPAYANLEQAAPPPEPVPEPEPEPDPAPPPPPPRRFHLDEGPDAVMKLYEKLRAERLARDDGDGKGR